MKARNAYVGVLAISLFATVAICGYLSAVWRWSDYQHALKYSGSHGFSKLVKNEILGGIPIGILMLTCFAVPMLMLGPRNTERAVGKLILLASVSPPLLLLSMYWFFDRYYFDRYSSDWELTPLFLAAGLLLMIGPAIVGTIIGLVHKRMAKTDPTRES